MGRLGFFLLGAVAGVVGTAVAAWAHDEYCGGSSSSSSGYDPDDEAENLRSQRDELDEKIAGIKAQREDLNEEIETLKAQRVDVERLLTDLNAAFEANAQSASAETATDEQPDLGDAHAAPA